MEVADKQQRNVCVGLDEKANSHQEDLLSLATKVMMPEPITCLTMLPVPGYLLVGMGQHVW